MNQETEKIVQKLEIKFLLEEIRKHQISLDDDSRLDFWNNIKKGYCQHCGRELVKFMGYDVCHCINDD